MSSQLVDQGAPGKQGPWFVTGPGGGPIPVAPVLSTTGADKHLALTTAATTALATAATATRRNLAGVNNGPNPIIVGFDAVAATLILNGTPVPAGGEFSISDIAPALVVYGIATVANQVSPLDTRISETG